LVLVRTITAPAGGAAPFKVSVPVEFPPPTTVFGFRVRDVREATFTVSVFVLVNP